MQFSKKVVILGHFGVGKTSLIRRIVEDSFSNNYEVSIGVHITKKTVETDSGTSVSLILWDLEGTNKLDEIRDSYLLGTHAVIFVFDVSRPSTFENIHQDLSIVKKKVSDVPIVVVGNKIDLVTSEALAKALENYEIKYDYLTSAKTGSQVDDLFARLAKMLVSNVETIQGKL